MRASKRSFAALPEDYAGLCRVLAPGPIHNQSDFRDVTEISDVIAGHALSTDQLDYFDLLCRLIEDWEKPQIPKCKASARETLQVLLEPHNECRRSFQDSRGPSDAWTNDLVRGTQADA